MNGRLARDEVAAHLAALRSHLTRQQASRMDAIVHVLDEDGRFLLRRALVEAGDFPENDARAQDAFQDFREAVTTRAERAGVPLALELDARKAPPDERYGWFTGGQLIDRGIAEFTGATAGRTDVRHAVEPSVAEVRKARPTRVYVSHVLGRDQRRDALLTALGDHLALDPARSWALVRPDEVGIGLDAREVADRWSAGADVRLALVSPRWLADATERARVLDRPGRTVAVVVSKLPDGDLDLGPLRRHDVLRRDRPWDALRNTDQKHEFVQQVADELRRVLDRTEKPAELPDDALAAHAAAMAFRRREGESRALIKGMSGQVSLAESQLGRDGLVGGTPQPAVDRLIDWATDRRDGAPRLAALLGDVGMGKTTTAKLFTRELLARRAEDPRAPLPILFDLRDVRTTDLTANLSLDHILGCMLDNTRTAGAIEVTADAVRRRVVRGGTVVVFDGLDEVLVHLDPPDQRLFTAQLFRVMEGATDARILLTCRSQYFRTVREQVGFFSGQGREGVRGDDHLALVMLPFTTGQVREYLAANLNWSEQQTDDFLAVIDDVHDLPDLSTRPVTLRMIADQVQFIERKKQAGEPLRAVDLYGEFVDRWLERDAGKHSLRPEHKRLLMEHVAEQLWRSGRNAWSPDELDDWLLALLEGRPDLRRRYKGWLPEQWTADFRTATFLSREGDAFSFAHRSLFEYFLARRLCTALADPATVAETWALPVPSPETLDFLGQSIAGLPDAERATAVTTLTGIGRSYVPQTSELAVAFALAARAHGYPHQPLQDAVLRGARLDDMEVAMDGEPLSLRGVDLTGASLRRASFVGADLRDVDLGGADLTNAEFHDCNLMSVRIAGATAAGTILRRCNITKLDLSAAAAHRAQALLCTPEPAATAGWMLGSATCVGDPPRSLALQPISGHTGAVTAVAYHPDGTQLATAGSGTVLIWDPITGHPLHTLTGHTDWVRAVAYRPDGTQLATAGSDGTVRIWNPTTGQPLRTLAVSMDAVTAVAYCPDGTQLATAGSDETVRIWNPTTGQPLHTLTSHMDAVTAVAYRPNGTQLATTGNDGTVRIWNPTTGQPLHTLIGHTNRVQAVAYHPTGTQLSAVGSDGTVRIWDSTTGRPQRTLTGSTNALTAVAYHPDGTQLATTGSDGTVRIWNPTTGQPLHTLTGHTNRIQAVAYHPDGTQLATTGNDTVRIWDPKTGRSVRTLAGSTNAVTAVAYHPDGTQLATTGNDAVRTWDPIIGRPVHTLAGHTMWIQAVAYRSDGTQLATGGIDGSVRIWDPGTGRQLQTLAGDGHAVNALAYDPDGTRLATTGNDGNVRIWDPSTGRSVHTLSGHSGGIRALAYHPAGTQLATGSLDCTVRVWDPSTGRPLHTLRSHTGRVRAVAYHPDGTQLAAAGNDAVRIWNPTTGRPLHTLTGHTDAVTAVAYHPDGTQLATTGIDRTVRIWNPTTGRLLHTLGGHTDWVRALAYHPDGTQLATAGNDGTVRIWNPATGRCIGRWLHLFGPTDVAVYDAVTGELIGASEGAWRWLGWTTVKDGRLTRLPAETFGPLPPLPGIPDQRTAAITT